MTTEEKEKRRQKKEKDIQIEINQSLKGVTWNESEIPTLTSQAIEVEETNHSDEIVFDIIEDFIPDIHTKNGHQPHCSCIKCQPKQVYDAKSALASIPIEKNIPPLNKRRFNK